MNKSRLARPSLVSRLGRAMKRVDSAVRPRVAVQQKFASIYETDFWTNGSGPGSSEEMTREYRAYLQAFLREHNIRKVIDLGCGDWQSTRLVDWQGVDYTGFDIVPSVVHANTARYGTASIRFVCGDVRYVSARSADLAIIKDVFQHLSNKSVRRVLKRLSAIRYLLVTNDVVDNAERVNADTTDGGYRAVRLDYAPFNLPGTKVLDFPSVPHRKATLLHVRRS